MKNLFSSTGIKLLESLTFTRVLYAFDFDGTLAPIVTQPEKAIASATTESLLKKLSEYASVAVISGRSVSDLRTRLKFHAPHLIGNHGLEGLGTKQESIQLAKKICDQWIGQLHQSWNGLSEDPGVTIENKTYSLALHYRRSRNKRKARGELFHQIQELTPAPRIILGKCVMNLIPSGGPHKGIALLKLMKNLNLKCAFYIGDDDTDEDVFSLPDSHIISARVGKKKTSQAQFFIQRQSQINQLLRRLVALHQKQHKGKA